MPNLMVTHKMARLLPGIRKMAVIRDFTLSILASLILTAVTQLAVYPYLSRVMTSAEYGTLLTVMGIVNAVGVTFGNSLNNARILLQPEYDRHKLAGDFNPIFCVALLISLPLVATLTIIVLGGFNYTVVGCMVTTALILFRSYYSASYGIALNYWKNLWSIVSGVVGYLIGSLLTHYTGAWIVAFIIGELFSCIYIYFTAAIVHDRFCLTPLFRDSIRKYVLLMSAASLATVMMYMDRFFIYPILGAEQVSVYNVASFLGKMAGIVMTPIAGVLLTYYAKESGITLSRFCRRTGLFTAASAASYLVILLIGAPIMRLLYPTLVHDAIPYFAIASLAGAVLILGNTIQPIVLRYCSAKWQPVIQVVYSISFLFFGYIGIKEDGLMGFCYSGLIANSLRVVMLAFIAFATLYVKKGLRPNEVS